MHIRSRHTTPRHAPVWVRARHWPAMAGFCGMAALVAVVAAAQGQPHTSRQAAHGVAVHGVAAAHVAVAEHGWLSSSPTASTTTPPGGSPALAGDVLGTPADAAGTDPTDEPAGQGGANRVAPSDAATISGLTTGGIPVTALEAYRRAADRERTVDPGCHLPWPLLAGIGRVESNHGRFGGAVLLSNGSSTQRILGIPLDGSRSATITDTDHGRLDGDPVYDRALGPMQFIPSTWASYGVDGNNDGKVDPFNIFDAAAAAAHYLCVAGGDLSTLAGQTRAVLAYNHSSDYLALVLNLEHAYAVGVPGLVVPVLPAQTGSAPSGPVTVPPPPKGHKPPPVDPGPPLSAPSGPTPPHPPAGSSTPHPHPTSSHGSSHGSSTPASTSSSASGSASSSSTTPPAGCPSTSGGSSGVTSPGQPSDGSGDSTTSGAPSTDASTSDTSGSTGESTSDSSSASSSGSSSGSGSASGSGSCSP